MLQLSTEMGSLFGLYALLLGLIVGSFLNVCIYRLPRGRSIVGPRSHCPRCEILVHWYDNIPVLSYLWLQGRCRSCHQKISLQYPLVEILTGLASFAVYLKFGGNASYLLYFLLLVVPLIGIAFVDFNHKIIPDLFSLTGIFSGLLVTLLLSGLPPGRASLHSLGGIAAGGGSLFVVSWLYEKLRHEEGIGGGDIKLAAMLGSFFGWKGVFVILLFGSFLGSLAGILLILIFHKGIKFEIPFGPFLVGGALIYLFFGAEIIHTYLRLTYNLY